MSTPTCPGCHAKFSIRAGTCTKCGLPEWQFVGIEDPLERGRAIARWKRDNKVVTAEAVVRKNLTVKKEHDVPAQLYLVKPTKSMRKITTAMQQATAIVKRVNAAHAAVYALAMYELEQRGADLKTYRRYERQATKARERSVRNSQQRRKHGRQHA